MNLLVVLLVVPAVLTAGGLAVDAGQVFVARREAQGIADAAARAGAESLDLVALRTQPGAPAQLDPQAARAAAANYVAIQQAGYTAQVDADTRHAIVRVTRTITLSFMRLAGFSSVRVDAASTAEPRSGIVAAVGAP